MGGPDARTPAYRAALGLAWLSAHGSHSVLRLLPTKGPQDLWAASPRRLVEWGVAPHAAGRFAERRRALVLSEAETALEAKSIRFIPFGSDLYPKGLEQLCLPPAGLFVRANAQVLEDLLLAPRITIVGTRKATPYGSRVAEAFASAFALEGIAVVSGMALGIDAHAHQAALQTGGLTMAILGCGVDVVYPRRHLTLYNKIVATGVVASELPPGTAPARWTFPHRNRLLAALGDAVLVGEASRISGALHTVDWALELGRPVFSVPGPITSEGHQGCNMLIYDGACPALDPSATVEDFLFITRMEREEQRTPRRRGLGPASGDREGGGPLAALDARKRCILDALSSGPSSVDDLARRTGVPVRELTAALAELELMGCTSRAGPGFHIRAP